MADSRATLQYLNHESVKPYFVIKDDCAPEMFDGSYQNQWVDIIDGRQFEGEFNLDLHGFSLIRHQSQVASLDQEVNIKKPYYAEIETIVKSSTGAQQVVIIDHTLRESGRREGVRTIATHVHNDYTEKSCRQRLIDHLGKKTALKFMQRRIVQINVWRPLAEPVLTAPLAVADGSSIHSTDLVPCKLVYPDRIGEIYEVKYNPSHRWYYFPRMRKDEIILIKGYDSLSDGRTRFTPHSAFHHPDTKTEDPPRKSIEVRAIALFD